MFHGDDRWWYFEVTEVENEVRNLKRESRILNLYFAFQDIQEPNIVIFDNY